VFVFTLNIGGQIARGLAFLHEQNIAHLDVSPHHILLFDSGKVVKLCDFSIGKVFEGLCGGAGKKEVKTSVVEKN